jgi:hypothetical protein
MTMMLTDPSFLNHSGYMDYTSTIQVCTKLIRLLIQYNRNCFKFNSWISIAIFLYQSLHISLLSNQEVQ